MNNKEIKDGDIHFGFAGIVAKTFIRSKLTPLIAIASLLIGGMAVWLTPKEEEPQISVPMIDIRLPAPGMEAGEVERKVVEPVERAIWGLKGVEYVYSSSQAHGALVTARFKVGEPIEPSLVKVHDKLMSIRSELPEHTSPIVKSYSIDDVPFLVLSFSSNNRDDFDIRQLIAPLARKLSSTPDLSRIEFLGGLRRSIRVIADPKKMIQRGVSLTSVAQALQQNSSLFPSGKNFSNTDVFDIDVGGRPSSLKDIESIAIGQRGGSVVHIKDIAKVVDGPEERTRASVIWEGSEAGKPAVSIVFAKRAGTNVVKLSKEIIQRAEVYSKGLPEDIKMSIVRDYGSTAEKKSEELIEHLLLATFSVGVLIALIMGIRASIVVVTAIPVTLALTLAIYYFMGYTLNRVTLFALIFSIGILVDDAIVVLENIERHFKMDKGRNLWKSSLQAVAEVGNPTILATFTVIASILPMAFVRGLMGPYMAPIPVGASLAMILSLFVAFIITPWAALKLFAKAKAHKEKEEKESKMDRLYRSMIENLLATKKASLGFGALVAGLFLLSASLVALKIVKVKMLPFDNKNEFQVLIDYPSSTSLSNNIHLSNQLAQSLVKDPNIKKVQIYAGESAPYSFSGMVKHTFLRGSDYQADLQIVMTEKEDRSISSHEIIQNTRGIIAQFAKENKAITKVLEIPPGPPVLATMMAEIYGPDKEARRKVGKEIYKIFSEEPSVVDLDSTWRLGRPRILYSYDQQKGGLLGTNASQVAQLGSLLFSETPVTSLDNWTAPEDIFVNLSVDQQARSSETPFKDLILSSMESGRIQVEDVLKAKEAKQTEVLYRKNLKPVEYVMSELAGSEESPVYGMLKLVPKIKYPTQTAAVPWNTIDTTIKWDGEWFITYEVFRDLGAAFAVVLILIYVLVVGWFKSFTVPLIIMAPIPISLIGIFPGHWFTGAFFTATSMIGFIAGAGVIVRNSIILVDFIEHQLQKGMELKEAVISAGVLRFRPMLLTAAAVVVGSSVMLADPIFQGLAVSLIFGEIAATLLSRFAVPVLYYWFEGNRRRECLIEATHDQEVICEN